MDSEKKLTGPLNKIVQFAGLLSARPANSICETILDWLAEPKNAKCWPEPDRFILDVLPDVFAILKNAGDRHRQHVPLERDAEDDREKWLRGIVDKLSHKTPLLAALFVNGVVKDGYKGTDELPAVLLSHFKATYVQSRHQLLPTLGISRFALIWLLGELRKWEGYEELKAGLTKNIIYEADNEGGNELKERILLSLVSTPTAMKGGKIHPDARGILVQKTENEQRYDMDLIKEALKRWYPVKWSDEVSKRAFELLRQEYDIG